MAAKVELEQALGVPSHLLDTLPLTPGSTITCTGANGSGKSFFLRQILPHLLPHYQRVLIYDHVGEFRDLPENAKITRTNHLDRPLATYDLIILDEYWAFQANPEKIDLPSTATVIKCSHRLTDVQDPQRPTTHTYLAYHPNQPLPEAYQAYLTPPGLKTEARYLLHHRGQYYRTYLPFP